MKILTEQALLQVTAGALVTSYAKGPEMFIKTYTFVAQIMSQQPMGVLEATSYYCALGHTFGEWLYTTFHPETKKLES